MKLRAVSGLILFSLWGLALGAVAQERPAITGIAFVRMYSADLKASDAFYGKTLGYSAVVDEKGIARYAVNRSQWLELEALPQGAPATRMPIVALTTHDVAAMERYLAAHQVAVTGRLMMGGFLVHDPEGNLIGFMQTGAMRGKLQISPNASSRRMIHAGFVVNNRSVEDKFYRDILGFHTYWQGGQTDGRLDYMSLQVPDGTDWLEYMLNTGQTMDARQLGVMNHFSLGVAQMSEAMTALARNGCSGGDCSKTQMGRDGKVQLNLFDPDLTRVEFMEFKPSGTVCCTAFKGKHPDLEEDQ
jgi:catechol 2,3-dioxygenase-like lactoylglutathione lyase family enzyme